ncbi:MAG TPA: hypothetical protein VF600_05630 [Abditibacteriaceae bacterium]
MGLAALASWESWSNNHFRVGETLTRATPMLAVGLFWSILLMAFGAYRLRQQAPNSGLTNRCNGRLQASLRSAFQRR